jgi:tetratricopeptide (TPR) repeat protein
VLLEAGRPHDAIEPFEQALRRNPNRSLSVLGRARAAAATGDVETARLRYRELLVNFDEADASLPEIEEAHRALATPAVTLPSLYSRSVIAAVAILAAAIGASVFVLRRRKVDQNGKADKKRTGTKKRARR